jgi:hypothetical protein
MKISATTILALVLASVGLAQEAPQQQDWEPVTGSEELAALFSGTTQEATLKDGVTARARYNRDGTGVLEAWGDTFERRWEVRGNDQICILISGEFDCFTLERNRDNRTEYRATYVDTGERALVFRITEGMALAGRVPATQKGGAGQPSAEEVAAKLANPNTPLASLTFKLQFRTFDGDLPGANDENGTTLLLQPSFPFPLANGDVVFFRPAIPVQIDFPVFDPNSLTFDSESGLDDIAFDLAYGRTTKTGLILAGGLIASLPTATDDALGTDRFTLGPEFLIGKLTKKYVVGAFPNHQWDVGGSGDKDINLTTAQLFYTYLPGGGWNVGTTPILSYDHESNDWTIPLNFTFGKTIIWNGRPWKLSAELNYFVEQPDAFGPEWLIGFNVAPVVENVLARWFK